MNSKEEMLKKLLALSKQGVGGEKVNAEALLNKLLKKHGLTIEDIDDVEEVKQWDVHFNTDFERKLIYQVMYMLFPDESVYHYTYKRIKHNRENLIIKLTNAQYIEFDYAFTIYKNALNKELELFYSAFIQKNHIYPVKQRNDIGAETIEDKYSMEDQMKIAQFANGITKENIRQAIDCNRD